MGEMSGRWWRTAGSGLTALLASAAAQAPADPLAGVERGRWRLHEIGTQKPDRVVCVADPHTFLQIAHAGATCSRHELELGAGHAGARYSCPGAGYGQTDVTVESAKLLRIQTQGIVGGQPFVADYEARHLGACG